MKPREYCCCAIPVIYTGIYATLTEQFVLGILAGTLSIGTPSIVGAATPSFAKWLFAIICYVGAAIQLMGFASVRQEKPILFRRYLTLHILITLAAFSIAGVWIVISAARHSTAQSSCTTTFFPGSSTDTITRDESNVLCKIIPWVDVGVMVALWVLLAVAQLYFYVVLSSYSAGQERDQRAYDSVYDPSKPLASDIPLATRADTWGLQQSPDVFANSRGYHDRPPIDQLNQQTL
ncbi:hypothetical protein WOLCODRAFT_22241 [Wolfiporia cocos MD-104 SS10]|uniref:Transmembrane protein n=1 Tax=Wolfiporia cocos (strain MD-104) TaxID=742152 RepID=A0A2H3IUX7_WOLCO|nr:hypothetical protein WOLCODRAFT_22241 [Wolfiporia cocos MD-104 SS10]